MFKIAYKGSTFPLKQTKNKVKILFTVKIDSAIKMHPSRSKARPPDRLKGCSRKQAVRSHSDQCTRVLSSSFPVPS